MNETQTFVRWIGAPGHADAHVLGGKGAGLVRMAALGLPVPPGFIVTVAGFRAYRTGGGLPDALRAEVLRALESLEGASGLSFGAGERPLLVSVRSGAPVSMPGMLDTVLNLGLRPASVEAFARAAGEQLAWDCYARFLEQFARIVLRIDADVLDDAHAAHIAPAARALALRRTIADEAGAPPPDDPRAQLFATIEAVFASWDNRRARQYRRLHGVSDDLGTAAVVQAMVFGNLGEDSGSGVVFSRDPVNGNATLYGEFLPEGQGEDLVGGRVTPLPLAALRERLPAAYAELGRAAALLEREGRWPQDIEFTVERGRLFVLQTRDARVTSRAGAHIASDLVRAGLLSPVEALGKLNLAQLGRPRGLAPEPNHPATVLVRGLGAVPGAAVGVLVLDASTAVARASAGEQVVLVRPETTPEDIAGIAAAAAVVTAAGGLTSHAAVVARELERPCVCGCPGLAIDFTRRCVSAGGCELAEGSLVTVDGGTGTVFVGAIPLRPLAPDPYVAEVLAWAKAAGPGEGG